MIGALPDELVVEVLSHLRGEDLRVLCSVCVASMSHVRRGIVQRVRENADRYGAYRSGRSFFEGVDDDLTLHDLLGFEMAETMDRVLRHAPERLDALASSVLFEACGPCPDDLLKESDVLWHDEGDVHVAPARLFGELHAADDDDWEPLILTLDYVSSLSGDEAELSRLLGLRPCLIHERSVEGRGVSVVRGRTKSVNTTLQSLHVCRVHAKSARLLASLGADLD